jgi:hypothetical protein
MLSSRSRPPEERAMNELDLIQVNQIAITRALARIAVHLGIDHPTDSIRVYSAILANHVGLGDGPQLGEQLQVSGSD